MRERGKNSISSQGDEFYFQIQLGTSRSDFVSFRVFRGQSPCEFYSRRRGTRCDEKLLERLHQFGARRTVQHLATTPPVNIRRKGIASTALGQVIVHHQISATSLQQ